MHSSLSHKNIRSTLLILVVAGLMLGSMSSFAKITSRQTKLFVHKTSSGEKGRDVITLATCYQRKSAVLEYKKKLFGYAKLVRVTCNKNKCSAIVDWKHKPAGRVDYLIRYKSASTCS